jgi:hypothetical protein
MISPRLVNLARNAAICGVASIVIADVVYTTYESYVVEPRQRAVQAVKTEAALRAAEDELLTMRRRVDRLENQVRLSTRGFDAVTLALSSQTSALESAEAKVTASEAKLRTMELTMATRAADYEDKISNVLLARSAALQLAKCRALTLSASLLKAVGRANVGRQRALAAAATSGLETIALSRAVRKLVSERDQSRAAHTQLRAGVHLAKWRDATWELIRSKRAGTDRWCALVAAAVKAARLTRAVDRANERFAGVRLGKILYPLFLVEKEAARARARLFRLLQTMVAPEPVSRLAYPVPMVALQNASTALNTVAELASSESDLPQGDIHFGNMVHMVGLEAWLLVERPFGYLTWAELALPTQETIIMTTRKSLLENVSVVFTLIDEPKVVRGVIVPMGNSVKVGSKVIPMRAVDKVREPIYEALEVLGYGPESTMTKTFRPKSAKYIYSALCGKLLAVAPQFFHNVKSSDKPVPTFEARAVINELIEHFEAMQSLPLAYKIDDKSLFELRQQAGAPMRPTQSPADAVRGAKLEAKVTGNPYAVTLDEEPLIVVSAKVEGMTTLSILLSFQNRLVATNAVIVSDLVEGRIVCCGLCVRPAQFEYTMCDETLVPDCTAEEHCGLDFECVCLDAVIENRCWFHSGKKSGIISWSDGQVVQETRPIRRRAIDQPKICFSDSHITWCAWESGLLDLLHAWRARGKSGFPPWQARPSVKQHEG